MSKLERDLGFANGYISQLKRGSLPDNRLNSVAEYLNVTPEYLSTGENNLTDPDLLVLARVKKNIPADLFEMVVKIALRMEHHFTTK